ncbi:MAG: nitrogenase component 1, partial [Myxococcota bacterium]|nr:nitrogenase component 1 [Myxococcota bacterium]
GDHRICTTDADVFNIARDRRELIAGRIDALRRHPATGLALVSALPMASVVGVQYDALIGGLAPTEGAAPVHRIDVDSFDGDWLEGYAAVLEVVAREVDLSDSSPSPDRVAVVGALVDRNEEDRRADLKELADLLTGLGLETVALLPGSGGFAGELRRASGAGIVISLPYGRAAARTLATRLDATLVETDLPTGLEGTTCWLRTVGEATGRAEAADDLAERRLARTVSRLEWVVPHHLLHRRLAFVGDPFLAAGLTAIGRELGFEVAEAFILGKERHRESLVDPSALPPATHWQPPAGLVTRRLRELHAHRGVDLVVTNTHYLHLTRAADLPFLELGFPDALSHHLTPAPTLGYRGCLHLAERLMNRLALFDALARPVPFRD